MSEEFDNYSSYSELNDDFVLSKDNLVNLLGKDHYLGRVMDNDYTASIELTDEARDWLNGVDKQTKVIVPKVFDDWLKKQEVSGPSLVSYVSRITNNPKDNPLETWIAGHWEKAVKAIIDSYEVENPKRGFKLPGGNYVSHYSGNFKLDVCRFIGGVNIKVSDTFQVIDDAVLKTLNEYLKGEIVEADDETK